MTTEKQKQKRTRTVVQLVVFAIGVGGFLLTNLTIATPENIQRVAMWLWLTAGVVVTAWVGLENVVKRVRAKERLFGSGDASIALAVAGFMVGLGVVMFGWSILVIEGAIRLYLWTQAPATNSTFALAVCVPATLVAGMALFWFRLKIRSLYGVAEVLVGLAVAISQVMQASQGNAVTVYFVVAYLTASLYLIVRGLDNIHQALSAPSPDPVMSWVRNRVAVRIKKT